jgi:hemolysin activation/secretion protein
VIPGERPGDERLEAPPFEAPAPESGPILPPFPIPATPESGGVTAGAKAFVREIQIRGNTVVSSEELREIAALYEGRNLSFADLLELRDRITLTYVDRGYVTSGATLPTQSIGEGVVGIEVIEGELRDIEIESDGRFRASYLRDRLAPDEPGPVNVYALERRLQILQRDRRIQRVDAQLVPSSTRGLSTLHVHILESAPYSLGADVSNYRNPSIGAYGGNLHAAFDNAFGVGDGLYVRGAFTEGLQQFEGHFSLPLTVWDTLLTFRYQWSEADIVSDPISSVLDIESRSRTFGLELRQPLYRSSETTFEAFTRGEIRRSESLLDGSGFSFTAGTENGRSNITALRFGVEWTRRTQAQAFALRSILSFGLDIFDATRAGNDLPDGRFVAWLGQLQWALRLPWLGAELLARADIQASDDPLLPLEQFAMGGRYTVRGYRENILVRDNGVVSSLEARLPLFQRIQPHIEVALVPFVDVGHSWNTNRESIGDQTLFSAGIGLRADLSDYVRAEIYWGNSFQDVPRVGNYDLQDDGVHFQVSTSWP